jgi:hypothetical protein
MPCQKVFIVFINILKAQTLLRRKGERANSAKRGDDFDFVNEMEDDGSASERLIGSKYI